MLLEKLRKKQKPGSGGRKIGGSGGWSGLFDGPARVFVGCKLYLGDDCGRGGCEFASSTSMVMLKDETATMSAMSKSNCSPRIITTCDTIRSRYFT